MSSDYATTAPVRLQYTLTADDLVDGFIAQHRSVHRPWYLRWLSTVLVVAVIGVSFVSSAPFGDMSAGMAAAFAVVLVLLVAFAVAVSLLIRRVFDGSRWRYRLQARQLMCANPMLSQPIQATVTETGAHLSSLAEGWVCCTDR